MAAADVYAAANNVAKLNAICQGQTRAPYKNWRKRDYACEKYAALKGSSGMKALRTASCAQLPGVFKARKSKVVTAYNISKAEKRKNFVTIGFKFAKCKNWDFIIEKLIHWGGNSGQGAHLLNSLHKAGKKVEKHMLAYMKRHKRNLFKFSHAGFALDHYTSFLHKIRSRNCRKYIPYAKRVADKVWGNFSWYFRVSKCKAAANIVAKRLSSPRWQTRKGACKTLGRIGTKRHLRKIKILARSDGYHKFVRGYRTYPVRRSCRAAAGQIRMR